MSGQRVGLLGGTFDPPHAAHVALARCAMKELQLDQLRVLPCGQPWHKSHQPSPAAMRAAMCRLAFSELPGAIVDERETLRQGPTYTIDTVRQLQTEFPGCTWYLIIGSDQAVFFERWHQWQQLLTMLQVAVAVREPGAREWKNGVLAAATELTWSPIQQSATEIRQSLTQGQSVSGLPPQVQSYIQQHHLYPAQTR